MLKSMKYGSRIFQLLIIVSLIIFTNACSGGGSGNSPIVEPPEDVECSDGFGDESRCNSREGL